MKTYLIIGASIAGLSAIDVLRQQDKEANIILVSEENEIYSKCIMHFYLSGERSLELLSFVTQDFMEKNQVNWIKGKKAIGVNTKNKEVFLSDNSSITYDKLLISTGSHAIKPPIKGLEGTKNIYHFHSLDDCRNIMDKAEHANNIVILGTGLVGVDVAFGLTEKNKKVTMIDLKEHMLAIQLDERAASVYSYEFSKRGVAQYYNACISEVKKNEHDEVKQVTLSDGTEIPCDLLILATGARANTEWLKDSDLELDQFGLVINDHCETNCQDVYGAGDVTGRDLIWPVAAKEARTAAFNMTGKDSVMTDFFEKKATINIFDIPTMSYGIHDAPDDTYQVEIKEGANGSYQKLIHKDGKVYGAILQKDLYYTGVLNQLKYKKIDVTMFGKPLLDVDYADLLII